MITGINSAPNGPFIRGFVYFPEPIDEVLSVEFLVDTGASITCLSDTDLVRLGEPKRALLGSTLRPAALPFRGVGGSVTAATTFVALVLAHDDAGQSVFTLNAMHLADQDAPSLLGRDVLARGDLMVLGDREVRFDVAQGTFDLT